MKYIYWAVRGLDAFLEIQYNFAKKENTSLLNMVEGEIPTRPQLPAMWEPEIPARAITFSHFYGDRFFSIHPVKHHVVAKTVLQEYAKHNSKEDMENTKHEFGVHSDIANSNPFIIANKLSVHLYPPTPSVRIRWFMRDRLVSATIPPQDTAPSYRWKAWDEREIKARRLIREVLSEKQYQRYIVKGKLPVRAASGRVYELSSSNWHMPVYEKGIEVGQVCIIDSGNWFCPSDLFLMRYLLLVSDEKEFLRIANWHNSSKSSKSMNSGWAVDIRTLPQMMKLIRQGPRLEVLQAVGADVCMGE